MADEYLIRISEVAFWAEADRLADWVLEATEKTEVQRRFDYFRSVFEVVAKLTDLGNATRAIFVLATMKASLRGEQGLDLNSALRQAYRCDPNITKSRISTDGTFEPLRDVLSALEPK